MNLENLFKVTKGYAPIHAFKKGDKVAHIEADRGNTPDGRYLIASNPRLFRDPDKDYWYTDFQSLNDEGALHKDIMYPGKLLLFRLL
jgi:hypothetical protein